MGTAKMAAMTIKEVARHTVAEQRIGQASEDMWGRAYDRWYEMRYGGM
ncbi:hypothetical protein GCM10010405_23390 [Streptomyces macrosporus]|uniref:Uncharacterized protein n=1 Tax=Streptomyces macrosporus TaxID=44032 RepID=A0ABN3JTY1_9ACTN